MRIPPRAIQAASVTSLLALLTACGSDAPEVASSTNQESTSADDETAPAPTPESVTTEAASEEEPTTEEPPTTGERGAPMALGETRALSNDSAFTVGILESNLDAADYIASQDPYAEIPADGESFVVGEVTVSVNADNLAQQGIDIESEGVDAWTSLFVEYVTADGAGYDGTSGTMCYTQDSFYNQPTLYSDGGTQVGEVCIAVPTDQVEGGFWRISNFENSAVWIQP